MAELGTRPFSAPQSSGEFCTSSLGQVHFRLRNLVTPGVLLYHSPNSELSQNIAVLKHCLCSYPGFLLKHPVKMFLQFNSNKDHEGGFNI